MGVAVLNPQDCLKQPFSHMKYPRNPISCPNKQKKPVPNRTRRSPPRNQTTRSPPPPSVAPPLPKKTVVFSGQFRILKRGEEIPKKTSDLVSEKSDLGSTRRIGLDPAMIRLSGRKSKTVPFYAGPVTLSSPPPSDVPLPAFFTTKKSVSLLQRADATNDLIRILRLDIA